MELLEEMTEEERTEEEAKKVVAKVLLPLENPLTAQLKVELPFVNTRRVEQRKAEKEKKKLRSSSIVVQMKELCRLWEPQFFSNITKPWESIDDLQAKERRRRSELVLPKAINLSR